METRRLLQSAIHEDRLLALFILVRRFSRGDAPEKKRIYELYLKNLPHINNWDLVDGSAEHIVGAYLMGKSTEPLDRLAQAPVLWERRIAVMATFHFIKQGVYEDTLRISETLLTDPEELIHKAVGWMLREVGKRSMETEEPFLQAHGKRMPRTMLRYAIERFPEKKRQRYLKGEI